MMSGDKSADGFQKPRPVLGDVTNRLGKRGLLLVSDNSGNKLGVGRGKYFDDKEGDSQFTQKVCQGVENIVKEKCGVKCVVNDSDKAKRVCVSPRPCSEINALRGNIISSISKVSSDVKESSSLGGNLQVRKIDDVIGNQVEVGNASKDSCVSTILMPVASDSCVGVEGNCDIDEGRVTSDVDHSDPRAKELVARVFKKECKDIGADNFTLGKHGSVDSSGLPESQGSGSFQLEKCIGLMGNESSNATAGVDLIKECSCSFCVKAGYIWSDLHYQDIKGRIAALKKSQKEANIMVQRSCRDKGIHKHSQENFQQPSKLESDLTGQWRSLFLHMEDILVREGSQLESSLSTLKDLRESCKTDLETINGMPLEKE